MERNSGNGLDLFWKLGDAKKEKTRLDIVQNLLNRVNNEGGNNEKMDTNYVLTRLIRGMASPKSRGSFFVALCELIRLVGPKWVSQIKKIVEETLLVKGTKSEEGEQATAHLLILGALLRSGVPLAHEDKVLIVEDILKVAAKRSYLSSSAIAFLKDFIEKSEDPSDETIMRNAYKNKYKSVKSLTSLDHAWMTILLHNKWPKIFEKEDKSYKFTYNAFMDQLASFLKEVTLPLAGLRSHPGLVDIIRFFCENELIHTFWTKHMDPYISTDSSYRSSVAFIVLSFIMTFLPSKDRNENITSFISKSFVGVSLFYLQKRNESTDEDRIILGIYENVVKVAEEVPGSQESLLRVLLTGTGKVTFDQLTGGSLISRMSALCSKEAVKTLGEIYKSAVTSGKDLSVKERLFSIQQFAKLTSHSALQGDVEWKVDSLKFLLSNAVFGPKKGGLQWNAVTRLQAKNTFFKGLDIKEKSFEKTCSILNEVLLFASKELKKSDALSEEHKKTWNKMMKVVKDLPYESDKKLSVFLILFAHMGFQLFHQPEMAVDALNDLHICYEKASQNSPSDDENEPKWTEVIVDLLLSLLSQNRSILRQVVNTVFSLISPFINDRALQMIVDVINPPSADEKESGDEDTDDDDEMDVQEELPSDDDEDDESSDSDGEVERQDVNEEVRKDVKSALGDFAADSDAGSIDPDDMDEESMKKIDEALAGVFKALCKKKSAGQKKREKMDAIAQVHFKIRALDMVDSYISRSSIPASHLIFLISPLLRALESALQTTREDTLSLISCIKNILKKISNTKKLDIDVALDQESLIAILKMFVGLANRGSPVVQQLSRPLPVFSKLCSFILKVIEASNNPSLHKKALAIYEKSLTDFFCRSHCLLPSNFFSIPVQNNRAGMWSLTDKIVSHTFDKSMRQFRRLQGFTLIMTYIRCPPCEAHKADQGALVESCVNKIMDMYMSDESTTTMPKFIGESLCILKSLHSSKHLRDSVEWSKVKEGLLALRGKIPGFKGFSELRKVFNLIASPLGVSPLLPSDKIAVVASNNFGDLNGEVAAMEVDDTATSKKKKKKKSKARKETLSSRKEKKSFELNGQFKGEEIPSFKGISSKQRSKFMHSNVVE